MRCVRHGTSTWAIACEPTSDGRQQVRYQLLSGAGEPPAWSLFDCRRLSGPPALGKRMRSMKIIARWANTDLWDALATAIIRQVIRAAHARRLYTTMCETFGPTFSTVDGPVSLFPDARTVLGITDTEFAELGLSFKRDTLRAAAQAYLTTASEWTTLSPAELVPALTAVHRVGEWTSRATAADYSNDFSLYPYGDLAVRTWATTMDAETDWPATDVAFARTWENMAAADLSAWTVSTLTFGAQHGRSTTSGAGTRTG